MDVLATSYTTVWWLNPNCKHTWQQPVANRVNSPHTCQICEGGTVLAGFNSLLDKKPYVAELWDTERNTVKPTEVTASSGQTIWLKCELGHSWKTTPSRITETITCQVCANKVVLPGYNDMATTRPELAAQFHPTKNHPATPHTVTAETHQRVHWVCEKNHEWSTKGNDRVTYNTVCPECIPYTTSKGEEAIADFIAQLGFVVERNKRKIIGQELDIFVPERNIAVEFNGVYWHTEKQGKHKEYHYAKWKACEEKNIQLIQVWEDDWNRNPDLVKRILAHKLGRSITGKVYARKTMVSSITQEEMNRFLNVNHIQGATDGSVRVALTHDDALVAVMLLKYEPGTDRKSLNLLRYATSHHVVGGFTKLLKHVENAFNPETIITFSDNMVSDGGLYENTGFEVAAVLPPDYSYLVNNQREHKFGYRLKRFKTDPALVFQEGLTERELADLNNLCRIWDAGKIKWVKNNLNQSTDI